MGSAFRGTVLILTPMMQITADVTARHLKAPDQGNHYVREILADAFPASQRIIDGRVYASRFLDIIKVPVEALVDAIQHGKRIVAAPDIELSAKFHQQRCRRGVLA